MAKHQNEWEEYIAKVCKIYGFKHRLNPTCFTKEGRLIGGYDEMISELMERFDVDDESLDEEDWVDTEVRLFYESAELEDRRGRL